MRHALAGSQPSANLNLKPTSAFNLYFSLTRVPSLYRQHLLVHTARTEGYSKLMLGDHCTRLAIKLLTSISLGRGAQLAQDTVRYGNVSTFTFAFPPPPPI